MKAVFDTNILIDFLNGKPAAKQELEAYDKKFISIITYIEILVGSESDEETLLLKNFLSNFKLIPVNKNLSLLAVEARQKYKLKIPDAIIWASAETEETILVTRDKVFPVNSPMVRVPYWFLTEAKWVSTLYLLLQIFKLLQKTVQSEN